MDSRETLLDAYGRIGGIIHRVADGASDELLTYRADPEANTIAWLIWHLARVQDDHVADVAGTPQRWHEAGWSDRFALPLPVDDTGYGHSPDDVAAVRASAELLLGYYDDVAAATTAFLATLDDGALDRVVDTAWNPPVTLGVRLISVIGDDLQHAGQAAYVKGLAQRAGVR